MYFIQPCTRAQCRECAERETARQHLRRWRRRETRTHRRRLDVRRSTALSAPVTRRAAGPSTCAATPAVRFSGQNVREARNFGGHSGVLVLWSRQRSPRRRLRECGRVSGSAGARARAIQCGSGAHAGRVDSAHQACAASTSACAEDCVPSYNAACEGGVGGPRPRKSIRGPCGDHSRSPLSWPPMFRDGSTASSRSMTTLPMSIFSQRAKTRAPVDREHASAVTGRTG
ncbi:hypothetical protein C8J57DRAFT_1275614 [Mycena rebaudengoi]|nr:hypothetical protein C8J57DRAFT_1275614 [Mycena rebaudengoi]